MVFRHAGRQDYLFSLLILADARAGEESAITAVDHAVIGGVVAVVVFAMLCLLIILGRYFARHKGKPRNQGRIAFRFCLSVCLSFFFFLPISQPVLPPFPHPTPVLFSIFLHMVHHPSASQLISRDMCYIIVQPIGFGGVMTS